MDDPRAVSRGDLESVCQPLESVFSQWKQKATPVAPETFDLLNRAIDLMARLLRLPETAASTADRAEISEMVRLLGDSPAPAAATAPPPVAPAATETLAARADEPPAAAVSTIPAWVWVAGLVVLVALVLLLR